MKSNDDFVEHAQEDYVVVDKFSEADITIENPGNEYRNSIICHQSEYDENPSEFDYTEDGWKEKISLKEKSLIERYKTLELLIKKKNMMTQVDA